MGEVITLVIIGIGVVLLLALQGLVLASMNKESEESEHEAPDTGEKSIMDAISEIMDRSHHKGHRFKVS